MALENISSGSPPSGRALTRALKELQGLKITVAEPANADVDIPVAGLGADDTLVSVLEVVDPGSAAATPVVVDRTADSVIQSAGNVRCSEATNGTGAGARVVVVWYDKGAL